MRVRELTQEVLFADDPIVRVARADIQSLKDRARRNERKRIRLCAHKDLDDKVHEMLIVHTKDAYVRPHKHLTKSESFHIIEGSAEVVIFNDTGSIAEVIGMSDYPSGEKFYYRMPEPYYHTLLITSDFLVFHETANGPFERADTVFPPWAPDGSDSTAWRGYVERLSQDVAKFLGRKPVHS